MLHLAKRLALTGLGRIGNVSPPFWENTQTTWQTLKINLNPLANASSTT